MSDLPLDSDGFVDMTQFDATDPDLVPALDTLGDAGEVPDLADHEWSDLFEDVFTGDHDDDMSSLVGEPGDDPFDADDVDLDGVAGTDDGDNPFDMDEMWGDESESGGVGVVEARDEADLDDELSDDEADVSTETESSDGADLGSDVGSMVVADDGADLGSDVGAMIEFEDDTTDLGTDDDGGDLDIGIEDDLDALENVDFDHG